MSSTSVAATVVIPTTGDRGPLLPLSVGSVLRQSVEDIEVFVIGDGLDQRGVDICRSLESSDARIRFFDREKGDRRGELVRHELLSQEARGTIVTYLCDRDLYLPWHVETMLSLLDQADFGHSLRFRVGLDNELVAGTFPDVASTEQRGPGWCRIPLSFAGHRLDHYRTLPFGWRTTPDEWGTDTYMWDQMLADPHCRFATTGRPSVLTFKRGGHPGWSTERRLNVLQHWDAQLQSASFDPIAYERELSIGLLEAHALQSAADAASPRGSVARRVQRLKARVWSQTSSWRYDRASR